MNLQDQETMNLNIQLLKIKLLLIKWVQVLPGRIWFQMIRKIYQGQVTIIKNLKLVVLKYLYLELNYYSIQWVEEKKVERNIVQDQANMSQILMLLKIQLEMLQWEMYNVLKLLHPVKRQVQVNMTIIIRSLEQIQNLL